MKLFGHPDSGHAFKVKYFLNWANIEHQYEYVDIFTDRDARSAEFLSVSKFAEVPALIDDKQYFIQSNAILCYLAEKYEIFSNAIEQQRCIEWLVWEANRIGMCLPQLRANEKFSRKYPEFKLSHGAYEWLLARFQKDINILNVELKNKKYILGNDLSPADFSLSGYLMYADEANIEVPKNVERWLDRLRDQDGWGSPYKILKG